MAELAGECVDDDRVTSRRSPLGVIGGALNSHCRSGTFVAHERCRIVNHFWNE
jgi:hypothetical protein